MHRFSLSHLTDPAVQSGQAASITQDCRTTATLLAHIAETDARRLYLPLGYSSMYQYCVREFHRSEDVASKRIRAARAARELPAIFELLADARLSLSGVLMLAPHLTAETAGGLLEAATHRTNAELEALLAGLAAAPDLLTPTLYGNRTDSHDSSAVRRITPSAEPESAGCAIPVGCPPGRRRSRRCAVGVRPCSMTRRTSCCSAPGSCSGMRSRRATRWR